MVHDSSRSCSTAGTVARAFRTNVCIWRNLRHGLLVAAVTGGTLSCEAGGGGPGRQVSNHLEEAGSHLQLALDWIGVASEGVPFRFGDVRGLLVDRMGRSFVLDGIEETIHVFDLHGVHIKTFGGSGAGPSELRQPIGMTFDPTGRLWVADPGNGRYSVFDTAGTAVEHHRRTLGGGLPWPGIIDSTGSLFDVGVTPTGDPDRFSHWIYRFPAGQVSSPTDSILLPDEGGQMFEVPRTGWKGWIPFTSRVVYDLDPNGFVWFGETGEYRLTKLNLNGDTILQVLLDRGPVPVTAEERRNEIRDLSSLGVVLPPGSLPSVKPFFESLHVTDGGDVWVYPYILDRPLGSIIDMFSGEGVYLGSATAESAVSFMAPPVVRGEFVYAITVDELNVPSLVRFRVFRSPTS